MSEQNQTAEAAASADQQQPPQDDRPQFVPPSDLPPDQLFRLAQDFVAGRVYTDRHCPEGMLGSVFLLGLGAFAGATHEQLSQVGMIYEYLDKAGPLSVNGCPMFLSLRLLSKDDVPRLRDACERIEAAVKGAAPDGGRQ